MKDIGDDFMSSQSYPMIFIDIEEYRQILTDHSHLTSLRLDLEL